ncbi:iron-sulfur cluster biosynthesis family protein [Lacticaseibacillus nasuensis]|uniref:Core domain-containing protein n=1 Tax=Lacticaseibacillus nasuensis JCM 17158 TaxID=1291734 RepID=A0A0R1JS31_9LACO|nr:iron-sulfur cluster biosynthesis family protein [Lacticaseibacillus nasuensis]KRK74078.1 hypothetical protein FD02_GL001401 [Lacticaseibacillus nasuensis JCM 17158]
MNITIKHAAKDYLAGKFIAGQHLFLALDDGSSKYSQLGGSCAIGNKWQIVVADAPDADYALPVVNDAGLDLTTGEEETMYLDNGLVLDYRMGALALRADSGILDGAVTVSHAQPQTAGVTQAIGAKTC